MTYKVKAKLPDFGDAEVEYDWDRGDPSVGIFPGLEICAVRDTEGVDVMGTGKLTAADEAAVDEAAEIAFTEIDAGEEEDEEEDPE